MKSASDKALERLIGQISVRQLRAEGIEASCTIGAAVIVMTKTGRLCLLHSAWLR